MSALYDKARQAFLSGGVNWTTADVRALLIDTADYTVDLATHEFLNEVNPVSRVAGPVALANKTATNGVADADDITFPAVVGDGSEAILLYVHTGTEGTSRLIAWIDSATGLPVTPNGGNINVTWNNGANKIFKL